ncbi:hypothetical protein NC652_017172 [Populus alba x Populus x berolinensis]|nr:hypothetical protein NC652_017172 [Populus alba x Populus x berolinensis]
MALPSPRGSNVLQYQCRRSTRFVWAGWRSRHETLCDDHDDLSLNRASDLFESLLGVHIQRRALGDHGCLDVKAPFVSIDKIKAWRQRKNTSSDQLQNEEIETYH